MGQNRQNWKKFNISFWRENSNVVKMLNHRVLARKFKRYYQWFFFSICKIYLKIGAKISFEFSRQKLAKIYNQEFWREYSKNLHFSRENNIYRNYPWFPHNVVKIQILLISVFVGSKGPKIVALLSSWHQFSCDSEFCIH